MNPIEITITSRPSANERFFIVHENVDDLEKVKWLWNNKGFWFRWSSNMYPKSARILTGNEFERWRGGCGEDSRGLWIRYVG